MGILRDEMTNHMTVKGYAPKTVKLYTCCVGNFSRRCNKSPLLVDSRDVESFFLYLRDQRRSDSTVHLYYEALRFFFRMHGVPGRVPFISFRRLRGKLPAVLSQSDVRAFLAGCASLKYRTIFTLIYSAGLCVSEAANLTLSDIDFERKRVFVRAGKNGKDRYTLLANETAALLRSYFQVYRPITYAFFGADPTKRISIDAIRRHFRQTAVSTLNNRSIHVHTLRHCFATHLIENGTSIFYVMRLLGHSSILTTMRYLHMQDLDALGLVSPIDMPPPPPVPSSVYASVNPSSCATPATPASLASAPSPARTVSPAWTVSPAASALCDSRELSSLRGSMSLPRAPARAFIQGDLFS